MCANGTEQLGARGKDGWVGSIISSSNSSRQPQQQREAGGRARGGRRRGEQSERYAAVGEGVQHDREVFGGLSVRRVV